MLEAPSIVLLRDLITAGARIKAYDPVTTSEARKVFPSDWFKHEHICTYDDQYDVLGGARAMILISRA